MLANHYVISMYIRLSKEDDDLKYKEEKAESNSITNQRMLIMDYIHSHEEFNGAKVIEKCDDGYSGKKFDRPAFLELIELAKKGEINCIIVKDLSRFGRDYVEIGDYLEQIFPFLGIRFISINDHYDSAVNGNQTLGIDVVFKNFIYDTYSRDTSRKIRQVRRKLAQEGSFASANAPYGYRKSKEDRHKLVINPDTAPVVKEIFELKLTGHKASEIVRILNARGVPSPAQYALNTKSGMDWRRINSQTGWDSSAVMTILRDERYVGHMVSLKRTLRGIYGKDTKVDQEEWIKVENTHEGIVSAEVFETVQKLIADYEKPFKKRSTNVFTCACCGRKMSRAKNNAYYLCRFGDVNPEADCYRFRVPAEDLQNAVLAELKEHFQMFLAEEEIRKKYEQKSVPVEDNKALYERNLKLLENSKTALYEQYREGNLSREEYKAEKQELSRKIQEYLDLLNTDDKEEESDDRSEWLSLIDKYKNETQLTPELQEAFIERVIVYSADRIKVVWKFEDAFEKK